MLTATCPLEAVKANCLAPSVVFQAAAIVKLEVEAPVDGGLDVEEAEKKPESIEVGESPSVKGP